MVPSEPRTWPRRPRPGPRRPLAGVLAACLAAAALVWGVPAAGARAGSLLSAAVLPAGGEPAPAAEEPGPYRWPVQGPVLRGFEAPASRFEAGHRGIDIGAPLGTPVRASAGGVVAFAGWVAGSRFVSVDHPDGIRTTYSWLSSIEAVRGQVVAGGQVIGATGSGHPEVGRPHLHFGARLGQEYLDPLVLLGAAVPRVHLAPMP